MVTHIHTDTVSVSGTLSFTRTLSPNSYTSS